MKKAEKKKPEQEPSGKQSVKKSGWKNVLEQMLEEARKQMENQAEPETAGEPLRHRSGWDDLISDKKPPKSQPEKKPELRPEIPASGRTRQKRLTRDEAVREKITFRPECMRCNSSMKEITDLGIGKQDGLVYCDHCGEQHKYQIINGELKLKSTDAIRKSVIAPEKRYRGAEVRSEMPDLIIPADQLQDDYAKQGEMGIYRRLSQEGLRNAVVWSEILGTPVGLRDMET